MGCRYVERDNRMITNIECVKCSKKGEAELVHTGINISPLYRMELPKSFKYFSGNIYCPNCLKDLENQLKLFKL